MIAVASSPIRSPSITAATVPSGVGTVTSGVVGATVSGAVVPTGSFALLQPASGSVQVITPAITMAVILL